ncbi:Uncharacterised protein at_DN0644 [Pycnogonum litorale]
MQLIGLMPCVEDGSVAKTETTFEKTWAEHSACWLSSSHSAILCHVKLPSKRLSRSGRYCDLSRSKKITAPIWTEFHDGFCWPTQRTRDRSRIRLPEHSTCV